MDFDYEINYKRGIENKVADALSRQWESEGSTFSISALQTSWMSEIQASWEGDELVQELLVKLIARSTKVLDYTYVHGMLRYRADFMWGPQVIYEKNYFGASP